MAEQNRESIQMSTEHEKHVIRENQVEILAGKHVFYNPVQEFNRDLSVTVLNVYQKWLLKEEQEKEEKEKKNSIKKHQNNENRTRGLRILEALSATGLRSIRYAKEITGVHEIIANDLSKEAVEAIQNNVRHNGVEDLVKISHADATTLMYLSTSNEKRFDCIDLDPYGSPTHYLDGALQAIRDGGLLLVTATDMAVLSGNAPDSCYVKYGSVPLRMKCCHEMALRILLHCLDTIANRYGKYIVPLLSVSVDFYIRVFVRVYSGQSQCKLSITKQSNIYQCVGCDSFTLQPLGVLRAPLSAEKPHQIKIGLPSGAPPVNSQCQHCHHKHHVGGPIWSAAIHDKRFVRSLLEAITRQEQLRNLGTHKRLLGLLTVVEEELDDIPLYYSLEKLCSVVKLPTMPILEFRSVLLFAGYRVSFSHAYRTSIKTDAPTSVLWDILRCWNKKYPVKESRLIQGTPLCTILSAPCSVEYDVSAEEMHPDANPNSRRLALNRYQVNPTTHWGPGTRATIMVAEDKSHLYKNQRNQNKKKKRLAVSSSAKHHHQEDDDQQIIDPDEDGSQQQPQLSKQAKIEETPSSIIHQ